LRRLDAGQWLAADGFHAVTSPAPMAGVVEVGPTAAASEALDLFVGYQG